MRSSACCRQDIAILSCHIHQTWPEPFSGVLYYSNFQVSRGLTDEMEKWRRKRGREIFLMKGKNFPKSRGRERWRGGATAATGGPLWPRRESRERERGHRRRPRSFNIFSPPPSLPSNVQNATRIIWCRLSSLRR